MRSNSRIRDRAGRRTSVLVLGAALALGSLLLAGAAPAADPAPQPTIVGNPVVGETLLASDTSTGTGVYRWQRCDPSGGADCSGAGGVNDPNYVNVVQGNGLNSYLLTNADAGKFIRVQVHDTANGSQGFVSSDPVGPVQGGTAQQGPQGGSGPQHGLTVLGEPLGGKVKVKLPGENKFSPLTETSLIPIDSVINVRKGRIGVTASTGALGEMTLDQMMEFFKGVFKITQSEAADAPAIAKLVGKLGCKGKKSKKAGASASSEGPLATTAGRRKKKRLWGSGSGSYGTRGRGGTGSVVGTTYLVKDTCKGTFFKVTEGVGISVDPKGKKKDVFLDAGESYFAALG